MLLSILFFKSFLRWFFRFGDCLSRVNKFTNEETVFVDMDFVIMTSVVIHSEGNIKKIKTRNVNNVDIKSKGNIDFIRQAFGLYTTHHQD